MLSEADIASYYAQMQERVAASLEYYEGFEDWPIEKHPEAVEIIEKIGQAIAQDDAGPRLAGAPHSELLAFLAHLGLRRAMRSTARIMAVAPGTMSRLMEQPAEEGSEEWTWQRTVLNRLYLVARLSLLRDLFEDEQIQRVTQAMRIAAERGYFEERAA
jgi:hypothetical protein